jgi:hypothetical protein
MADENRAQSAPVLIAVLSQLASRDRIALVRHLNDSLAHVRVVAEGGCGTEAPPPLTLHQVGDHRQAAIHHLERATGVLRLPPDSHGAADAQRG